MVARCHRSFISRLPFCSGWTFHVAGRGWHMDWRGAPGKTPMAEVPPSRRPVGFRSVLLEQDSETPWEIGVPLTPLARGDFVPEAETLLTKPPATASDFGDALHTQVTGVGGVASSDLSPHASHAADRLARAIVLGAQAPSDPRTLAAWGQHVGVSRGALRVWCQAAAVPARACLDFTRVFRAVLLSSGDTRDLFSALDVVDERSLVRLLERGGVGQLRHRSMARETFLLRQRYITDPPLLDSIVRHLRLLPRRLDVRPD